MLRFPLSDVYWLFLFSALFWITCFTIAFALGRITAGRLTAISSDSCIYLCLVAVAFSFLGLAVGLMVGVSRSPVTGVTIPALLAFYGALVSFLFLADKPGNEGTASKRYAAVVTLIAMSLFIVVGDDYGSSMRIAADARDRSIVRLERAEASQQLHGRDGRLPNEGSGTILGDSSATLGGFVDIDSGLTTKPAADETTPPARYDFPD